MRKEGASVCNIKGHYHKVGLLPLQPLQFF